MNHRPMHRLALAVLLSAGCTTIRVPVPPLPPPEPSTFSHALFDRVLRRHVDDRGRVDYAGLEADRADLDAYLQLVAVYSPDSDPALFPTRSHELAYWINAYNAGAIAVVLHSYPIAAVAEVRTPFPFNLVSDKAGFFFFQRLTFGGETTNLYLLENWVIRPRFREPRVHFVLNCASRGCPRLPRRAFTAEGLEEELERETRSFFSEERNLRRDPVERVVYLSSILDWYSGDFTDWLKQHRPDRAATLLSYVALYAPPRLEVANGGDDRVRFLPYDWRLNDQNGGGPVVDDE